MGSEMCIRDSNIGINEFGESAPGKDVAKHLGFVKEKITTLIEDYLDE